MPICRNCNKKFPSTVVVNGHKKNLSSKRRYCLTCSPFGTGNKRKLEGPTIKTLTCTRCGKEFENKFNMKHCASCWDWKRRNNLKKKMVDYKGGKCSKCGYDRFYQVLEFHHTRPDQKDYTVGTMKRYSWAKIKEELDKCDILCANCHRELHTMLYFSQRV